MNAVSKQLAMFQEQNYSYEAVYEALNQNSRPHIDFYVLMLLASIISTFGLLLNNAAVIIGAMLIAPLMDPILGISFSSLTRNWPFVFRSLLCLISGILLAILVSYLLSLPFSTLALSQEVLSRTKPSLLDLFVALATGFLAGYAKVRKNLSGAVFGVAVSISLIPPLCVIGIGLSSLKSEIYAGATLLFLTNLVSILFSGVLAFLLLEMEYFTKTLKSLVIPGVSVLVLSVPLSFSLYTIQQKKMLEKELIELLKKRTYTFHKVDILDIQSDVFKKPISIEVTVRGKDDTITAKQVRLVEELLKKKTGAAVSLTVNLSPIIQIRSDKGQPLEALETNTPKTAF